MKSQILLSRQLDYFIVVYRQRNFVTAAKSIPISYQGLRKAIDKLESDIGVPLFRPNEKRNDGTIVPTSYADLLFDTALKWTGDIAMLEERFSRKVPRARTMIGICSAFGIVECFGYTLIPGFSEAHPNMQLHTTALDDDAADEALLNGEYGIGFTVSPFNPGLVTHPLATNGCSVWINRSHPLSERKSIRLADLDDEDIAIPGYRYKAHRFFIKEFAAQGIEPRSIIECTSPVQTYECARLSKAISVFVPGMPEMPLAGESVVSVPVEDGYFRTFGISYRRGHTLTEDERCVFDYILENAAVLNTCERSV